MPRGTICTSGKMSRLSLFSVFSAPMTRVITSAPLANVDVEVVRVAAVKRKSRFPWPFLLSPLPLLTSPSDVLTELLASFHREAI